MSCCVNTKSASVKDGVIVLCRNRRDSLQLT